MIRLVTYNIKHGGLKGLQAIADVLAGVGADLVALQEVDIGVGRSHGVDQAAVLGDQLGMHAAHGPAFPLEGGLYGVALLSRFPIESRTVIPLPSLILPEGLEPRIALDARLDLPAGAVGAAGPFHVVVTHFGLDPAERLRQAEALVGHIAYRPRTVVAGDLNEEPEGGVFQLLATSMVDLLAEGRISERRTFPSWEPEQAIDHAFRSRDLPASSRAFRLLSDASDHLPVVVELG